MKKFLLTLMVFFALAAFLSAQTKNAATIKFVIGNVERLPANETSWEKASLNGKVFKGDRLKTEIDSRIEIEMPDGSQLKIDQNTIFDVKEIKTDEEDGEDEMSFSLWVGNIWAKFKKVVSSRQSRSIESPSAVVAVRGTTFEVNVDQQQVTRVSVEEGQVAVASKDVEGEVLVGSNQQTTVKPGEAPSNPSKTERPDDQSPARGFVLQVDKLPIQQTDPAVLSGGIQISGRTLPGASVTASGIPLNVGPNGQFNGRVNVVEGFNNINVVAEAEDKRAAENVRFFVNTKKPQIRLSTPLIAGFLNRRDYSLSGAVFDETPLDKITVYLNGEELTEVRGRGSFNRTIILQEGKNDINIRAVDLAKNTDEKSERIFLDTVKPIITITEPPQSYFTRLEPPAPPDRISSTRNERFIQVVRGVIIDPEPSSRLKRITINGKEVKPNSDGSFETEVNLARGENTLQIYAEDLAGNITRDNTRRIIVR